MLALSQKDEADWPVERSLSSSLEGQNPVYTSQGDRSSRELLKVLVSPVQGLELSGRQIAQERVHTPGPVMFQLSNTEWNEAREKKVAGLPAPGRRKGKI